jgi:hypothetical protein
MRRAALLAAALSAACSPEPRRAFPIGFLGPVSPRVAAEAARLGLEVSDRPPAQASVETAAVPGTKDAAVELIADWEKLRFLAARAAARGADGIFFRLPREPEGRDLLDYTEEWQAMARVAREMVAMRPILESGRPSPSPFPVPAGVEAGSWTREGRRYVLMVNASVSAAPIDVDSLAPWRALFAVRSDPRQVLAACGRQRCLPPSGVLWLEGRIRPGQLP